MTRAQEKHREFSLNQSVATLVMAHQLVKLQPLQGCVYWLNMSGAECVEGIQLGQLTSHYITHTVVATVAKYRVVTFEPR